jgi:transcriptional regulator with XRE-family HTH domain
MSYGKYLAFRAAQEASASGREGKTTAKPKRSMPPGASLGLAEARRRMGLSREEAALKLGVHMLSIKNWETGKNRPRAQFIPALARLYGLEEPELRQTLGLEEPGREQAAKRGQALRQIRLRAGLSLEQAAWRMDVTASAVRQWETGKNRPKPQSQRKIAQAYGLEPAELERMLEARP